MKMIKLSSSSLAQTSRQAAQRVPHADALTLRLLHQDDVDSTSQRMLIQNSQEEIVFGTARARDDEGHPAR